MFILGFHFPASEGNVIPSDKVVAKVDDAIKGELAKVKEIKIYEGTTKSSKIDLYKTYTNKDTFMAKALVHYFIDENEAKQPKYMVYTNKYQISELSKQLDKDEETLEICKKFDGMDTITVDVIYS